RGGEVGKALRQVDSVMLLGKSRHLADDAFDDVMSPAGPKPGPHAQNFILFWIGSSLDTSRPGTLFTSANSFNLPLSARYFTIASPSADVRSSWSDMSLAAAVFTFTDIPKYLDK